MGGLVGCGSGGDSTVDAARAAAQAKLHDQVAKRRALERKLARAKREAKREKAVAKRKARREGAGGATAGGPLFDSGAPASFESLAASLPAQIGLAVAPLGGDSIETFGSLQAGHAWSTIKVPILVTLMRDRGSEGLGAKEGQWAAEAIEASDNEAATNLFDQLEEHHGGLAGASSAVGETLAASGSSTTVATAPPPPGAVSTYGQTKWSLEGSAVFFRSLANGCLLGSADTEYVLGLMREVIPEQRWGLGEAGFDPSWAVGMKGGWGEDVDFGGGYLVRQSGVVQSGSSGVAVALIAADEAGTYEAGAADLTRIASWLRENLRGLGGSGGGC